MPSWAERYPDATGHFGEYGGRFVAETLMSPLEDLARAYDAARRDPGFQGRLAGLLKDFVGRPTPLTFAARLTAAWGGARVFLKREDLCHTGAHKINNTLGQALLTQRMGKPRVIAETGAGQHGVAAATAAALLGLACEVYMGAEDMRRQAPNVFRMRLLGAQVHAVDSGSRTLKDAINEALRDWAASVEHTHYILGSVLGPDPFPRMVRDFQAVIGRELRAQLREREGRGPDCIVACVGGGSNALGAFFEFLDDPGVRLVGVEAGGLGIASGRHAARFAEPAVGVLHGTRTHLLQDEHGQVRETHSVSAGLDYPAVGPEHALLFDLGRVEYAFVPDDQAVEAFSELGRLEGILPALETAHAVAHAQALARELGPDRILVINVSGRGDKDLDIVRERLL
ncbi:MAG TPA: tryptophan synthase subunit beta [Candidatus Saccharimonadales bacterium]|nr:tryptophan synthase subunit beta [Candidatus Saccharimonadales bacterium]